MSTVLEELYEKLVPAKDISWSKVYYAKPLSSFRMSKKKQKEELEQEKDETLKAIYVFAYLDDQFKTCAIIKEILEERKVIEPMVC